MATKECRATVRYTETLEIAIKELSKETGKSANQLWVEGMQLLLTQHAGQSLEVATQLQAQLEKAPDQLTDKELFQQMMAKMATMEAQIQQLTTAQATAEHLAKEQYTELKARQEKANELSFVPLEQVTKQCYTKFTAIHTADGYQQKWRNKMYYYLPEFGIIVREGQTKSGRTMYTVLRTEVEDLQVDDTGNFISPKGNYGYNAEQWAAEGAEEDSKAKRFVVLKEDEEEVRLSEEEQEFKVTTEEFMQRFDLDARTIYKHKGSMWLNNNGRWEHWLQASYNGMWGITVYVRNKDYAALVGVKKPAEELEVSPTPAEALAIQ